MSSTTTISPREQQAITQLARQKAVEVLSGSGVYQAMSLPDQQSIYFSLVDDYAQQELAKRGVQSKNGIAKSMATDSGSEMGYKGYDPACGYPPSEGPDLAFS